MKNHSENSVAKAPIRVLVIDDDEDLSQTMIDSLREEGISAWAVRPTPSSPSETVVATAALFQPHVILVDIVMPVNTAKLIKQLRASPDLANAVLVGCSGHATLAEGLMKHLDGFLHKPFTRGELIESLIEAASMRDPAPVRAAVKSKSKAKTPGKSQPRRRPARR